MVGGRRSIVIDARVNGMSGAHGLARSLMKLTAHMSEPRDDLALRVLVNPSRPQLFPLADLPGHADLVATTVTLGAVHRCGDLAELIRALRAAVLYVPYAPLTPLIVPCPYVVTVHDCTVERDTGFAGTWLLQAGMKLATSLALRRAVAATAPSRASLAELSAVYPSAPNPTLVPNGVDVTQFGRLAPGSVAEARQRYQLPDPYILAVGAHRPHKNHEVLVRALAAMPADLHLVIVGGPDARFPDSPLPGLIAELGLQSRVRLVREVAEADLPAVYGGAAAFAFPSLAEGFGLPVLEAMAAGVPVVMSNIPVLAEVAGTSALMVAPSDVGAWASALVDVVTDRALASRLSAAGTAAARRASWQHGARALSDLLSDVAAGRVVRPSRAASASSGQ
jgi:glycosyltransferase involved in cell wall biosynthesis